MEVECTCIAIECTPGADPGFEVGGATHTAKPMQPIFSLHCTYTPGTLQVHSGLSWAFTVAGDIFLIQSVQSTPCCYTFMTI